MCRLEQISNINIDTIRWSTCDTVVSKSNKKKKSRSSGNCVSSLEKKNHHKDVLINDVDTQCEYLVVEKFSYLNLEFANKKFLKSSKDKILLY